MYKKIFALFVAGLLMVPAAAAHTTESFEGPDGETYYANVGTGGDTDHNGVYQETNGCDGLQTHDATEEELGCDIDDDPETNLVVPADESVLSTDDL